MAGLSFFGAAQEVTGSSYLLETERGGRILLECGMHQGGDAVQRIESEHFAFDPADIDVVIISHAHLDHSGLLPKLFQEGFSGPVICTHATVALLEVMLKDSVGLYLRDLERLNQRNSRRGKPLISPAFTNEAVDGVLALCEGHDYGEKIELGDSVTITFHDAGHILGSSIVEIRVRERDGDKTLVFSGDLGKHDSVLMNEPARLEKADILLVESTYGDREHRGEQDSRRQLRDILRETWRSGGSVMIPAFAVGRTQDILYHLGSLYDQGELDSWEIFLDSPMAIAVTRIYDYWLGAEVRQGVRQLDAAQKDAFRTFLSRLNMALETEQSMAINRIKSGAIIIAGSGMCTGGRIRHHLKQRVGDDRNVVIFTGYQARGTLGRLLVDGVHNVSIFGDEVSVRARIETLGGLSAHAGQSGLVEWITAFDPVPRVMLVHGEDNAQDALSGRLLEQHGITAERPAQGQYVEF